MKHKIETFEDMVNCTNPDNVNAFVKDLKGVLNGIHLVRSIHKLHTSEPFDAPKVFTWIDDGKNNIDITLKPTDK